MSAPIPILLPEGSRCSQILTRGKCFSAYNCRAPTTHTKKLGHRFVALYVVSSSFVLPRRQFPLPTSTGPPPSNAPLLFHRKMFLLQLLNSSLLPPDVVSCYGRPPNVPFFMKIANGFYLNLSKPDDRDAPTLYPPIQMGSLLNGSKTNPQAYLILISLAHRNGKN